MSRLAIGVAGAFVGSYLALSYFAPPEGDGSRQYIGTVGSQTAGIIQTDNGYQRFIFHEQAPRGERPNSYTVISKGCKFESAIENAFVKFELVKINVKGRPIDDGLGRKSLQMADCNLETIAR